MRIDLEEGMSMGKKKFLTYNQQMRKLRDDKKFICTGTAHKAILARTGYFNLINGYKEPFSSGKDQNGKHVYGIRVD